MSMSDPSGTEHELRRLVPRQFVGWKGRYVIEGVQAQGWRDCQLTDISSTGAGVELVGSTIAEVEGQRIVVSVQLQGEIRHSRESGHGRIAVGVEFLELTKDEEAYIASLKRLDARW